MIITDAGLHVWQANTPENPWSTGRKAHLAEPISYENLRVRMVEAGVHRAILVPPSFVGDRSDYSLEAAAKYPDQFAVMGRVPLEKPAEGKLLLESWANQPAMLGARLTFHHEEDEAWIKDGTADWFWPMAERLNLPVMLNAPSILPDVAGVAERFPKLRLIIDHMGRLKGMKDEALGAGIQHTIALAKYPNVYVKLTLAPTCSSADYPYRNIHPYLKQLIDTFGPRRCFWGTDLSALLSRSKCTYRQAVTMFTEEMDFLSQDDLEWVMGRALAECLPWPVASSLEQKKAA